MSKSLKQSVIAALLIYIAILCFLFFFQRNLQYHPKGEILSLASYKLDGFEEKKIATEDNIEIFAWYKKPDISNGKIILYFHGNAGNLGDRSSKIKDFAKEGFGILAISYRGYYGSSGSPSEAGLLNDARTAINFLIRNNYKPEDIILFGESLGSGVAMQLSAEFKVFAVVLESPFSSITNVAQNSYWFVPVDLILKDKFESIKYANKNSAPVLIFHGTEDRVVAYLEGKKLFESITAPKRLVTVEGAGHLNFEHQFLLEEMRRFFAENANVK